MGLDDFNGLAQTMIRRASSVFKFFIPLSKRSVSRSSFVSSVFCSGVIDAERRRWRAPEKLRRIAAICLAFCA